MVPGIRAGRPRRGQRPEKRGDDAAARAVDLGATNLRGQPARFYQAADPRAAAEAIGARRAGRQRPMTVEAKILRSVDARDGRCGPVAGRARLGWGS